MTAKKITEPVDLDIDLRPPTPDYWVIDKVLTPEEQQGRHPGAVRILSGTVLVGGTGRVAATAFEFPADDSRREYWRVDVESFAIKAAGLKPLGLSVHGFAVRSEEEARDWLQLFGAMTLRGLAQ